MKKIYIDADFRCHLADDGGYTHVETDYFDDKCDAFIEGYRYIPSGQTWTREDGAVFQGEMISPWKPWPELDAAQREYERELLTQLREENADMQAALAILEVTPDE